MNQIQELEEKIKELESIFPMLLEEEKKIEGVINELNLEIDSQTNKNIIVNEEISKIETENKTYEETLPKLANDYNILLQEIENLQIRQGKI